MLACYIILGLSRPSRLICSSWSRWYIDDNHSKTRASKMCAILVVLDVTSLKSKTLRVHKPIRFSIFGFKDFCIILWVLFNGYCLIHVKFDMHNLILYHYLSNSNCSNNLIRWIYLLSSEKDKFWKIKIWTTLNDKDKPNL